MTLADKFADKWVVKPTKLMVRQMGGYTDRWFDDRKGMYDDHVDMNIQGTTIYARVRIDHLERSVRLRQTSRNSLSVDCECLAGVFMYQDCPCIHAIAALQYLADNFEKLTADSYMRKEKVAAMLDMIPHEQALEFLSSVLTNNAHTYTEFVEQFGMGNIAVKTDYNMELDRMYYTCMDSRQKIAVSLDFGGYFGRASDRADSAESAEICKAMSEAIHRNMHMVNDSDGYYTDCFVESVENMAESILQLPDKSKHIEYLATMMAKMPPNLAKHYRSALETVCVSGEDLDRLSGFLQELLGRTTEPERIAEVTHMQIYILEERDEEEEDGGTDKIIRLLADTYRLAPALRVKYIEYLKQIDAGAAKKAAMEIVKEFPDDKDAADAALDACERTDPEYATLSLNLFTSTGDWKYYTRMKESPSWSAPDTVRRLVDLGEIRKSIDLCIKERMYDDGMRILESKKRLGLLTIYVESLGKKYSERYFDAYSPLIRKMVASKAGGRLRRPDKMSIRIFRKVGGAVAADPKYNERVRSHLLHIRGLGDRRYADLVNYVRSKSSRNTSLLAAIRDL